MMNTQELRPLTLGRLLDRAFSCYRDHFILFVGIMAIPQVFIVGISLLTQRIQYSAFQVGINPRLQGKHFLFVLASAGLILFLMLLGYVFAYAAALGGTTFGVSEIYLGRQVTIRAAYGRMRGRVWVLLRVLIVISVSLTTPLLLAGLIMALMPLHLVPNPTLLLVILILLLVATVPWTVWMLLRYSLAIPALLLEGVSAREAIKRSAILTKGYLGQLFLIVLLMMLIGSVIATVFEGPFWIAIAVLAAKGNHLALWLGYPMAVAGGIGRAVSSPLLAIAIVLAYYDTRIKKEGFDLQVMMASLDNVE